MKRLSAVIVYFLIVLSFSGNMAKAQELTAVPDQIQGNWALPRCGINKEALLFTRYFYLKSSEAGLSLRAAGLKHEAGDYMILSIAGAAAPVRVDHDRVLSLALLEKSPAKLPRHWPQMWAKLPHGETLKYASCDKTSGRVPANMLRLMRYADRLRDTCSISGDGNCARVIFKFADSDNNKKVGLAEIVSATHSLMLFAELAAARGVTSPADLDKIKNRAAIEGGKIADDLLARYDANKSGDLDYNETMGDVTPPLLPIMREMMEKSSALLPHMGIIAMAIPRGDTARKTY